MDIYTELLEMIAGRHLAGWNDYEVIVQKLKAARTGNYQEAEDARKRLLHPWLKTTNVKESIISLQAKLSDQRAAFQEPLIDVLTHWIEIELGELSLQALKDADQANTANRRSRKETGLYSGARSLVDTLYEKYNVSSFNLDSLPEDSVKAIAAICLSAQIMVEEADMTVIRHGDDHA